MERRAHVWITLCVAVLFTSTGASPEVAPDSTISSSSPPPPKSSAAPTDIRCCPNGMLRPKKYTPCVNWPDHRPLQCNDVYRLEPKKYPDDRFLEKDGRLFIGDDSEPKERGQFCLGTLELEGNHSEETALVCFSAEDDMLISGFVEPRNMLNGVCLSISVAFLVITLLVYCWLPELRDLDGRVLMTYVGSLAVADLVLALLQFHGRHLSLTMCITQAFCLYFWLLAAFFWMNVVCFNIWRRTTGVRLPISERHLYFAYFIYGFGMPVVLLIFTIFSEHFPGNHLKPQFGVTKCWFQDEKASWAYFYGPVTLLLTCNIFYFLCSVWALWRDYSHIPAGNKLRSLRCKCCLYLKLAVLMGISWIFEVISFVAGDWPFFTYVTDVLNSLQGFLIFVLLVATRKRVLRLMAKRRPCGMSLPERWIQGLDEESEAMMAEEEPAQLDYCPPTVPSRMNGFATSVAQA